MRDKKFIIGAVAAILLTVMMVCFCSCSVFSEANKVNYNLSLDADQFKCERKITVYNARTDTIILEAEGYMSLANNDLGELIATFKVGEYEYKKNYIYLNDDVLYVVEDISGTHEDPYHYKIYFHTSAPVRVEAKP